LQSWTRRAAAQEASAAGGAQTSMIASPGARHEPGGSVLNSPGDW